MTVTVVIGQGCKCIGIPDFKGLVFTMNNMKKDNFNLGQACPKLTSASNFTRVIELTGLEFQPIKN
eukprot:4473825-Ditylum_brightwellii.AAC.1